jgi:hypothetical protein
VLVRKIGKAGRRKAKYVFNVLTNCAASNRLSTCLARPVCPKRAIKTVSIKKIFYLQPPLF